MRRNHGQTRVLPAGLAGGRDLAVAKLAEIGGKPQLLLLADGLAAEYQRVGARRQPPLGAYRHRALVLAGRQRQGLSDQAYAALMGGGRRQAQPVRTGPVSPIWAAAQPSSGGGTGAGGGGGSDGSEDWRLGFSPGQAPPLPQYGPQLVP